MAASLNKVTLIGNIGKDPEIRATSDGRKIANLVLATSDVWKDKLSGEKKERTEWHKLVIFSEALVGIVENYVKKGSKIYIEGALQTRKWVDNAGQDRYTTEIVLQNYSSTLTLLDSKNSEYNAQSEYSNNSSNKTANNNDSLNLNELDDEIPF